MLASYRIAERGGGGKGFIPTSSKKSNDKDGHQLKVAVEISCLLPSSLPIFWIHFYLLVLGIVANCLRD